MSLQEFGKWAKKYMATERAKDRSIIDPDGVVLSSLDEHGREVLDDVPRQAPDDHVHQPSLAEQIRAMIRSEKLAQEAEEMGAETFEESEDFDIGDDYDPRSPWENDHDPSMDEVKREVSNSRKKSAPPEPPSGSSNEPDEP